MVYANGTEVGTGMVSGDGSLTVTTAALADGEWAISYRYVDGAGNESASSPALNVTIDTVADPMTLDTPVMDDDRLNAAEAIAVLLSGTAEPDSVIDVALEDSDGVRVATQVQTDGAGVWTLLGNELDVSALREGGLAVDLSMTDVAGNATVGPFVFLALDVTGPAEPTVDALATSETSPTLTGAVSLEAGQSLEVRLNGVTYPLGNGDLTWDGEGAWTLVVPVGDALADGVYEVLVGGAR